MSAELLSILNKAKSALATAESIVSGAKVYGGKPNGAIVSSVLVRVTLPAQLRAIVKDLEEAARPKAPSKDELRRMADLHAGS